MSVDEAKQEEDNQVDPSHFSVFVHWADSYIGAHVVKALKENNYIVYGDKKPVEPFAAPNYWEQPEFDVVTSVDEAFALCNTFIFDIRDDPTTALSAFARFEAASTNIKIILISTLMTWALTQSSSPLTGDDFRKRRPHPAYQKQYETELHATKLCRENPNVDVYVLSCGIPYGDGEDMLFPFMKFAWSRKFNESVKLKEAAKNLPLIGDGENIVPMIHVRDLASLLISTLKGQMIDRFVMAVDKGNNKLREIIEAIAKSLSDGQIQEFSADQSLMIPWLSEQIIEYMTANISAVNELLGRVTMSNPNGFVSSIAEITEEFLNLRKIQPLRVLVCGPPLSGKSFLASRISYRYSLPLITVDSIVSEAKKNENNYYASFAQQLQGEISPNLLLDLLKWKLQDIPCKNQGFILDGIPSNADFAEALWAESTNSPQIFIELEADDEFLRDRAKQDPSMMLGIGNTDEFETRLNQYRSTNSFDENHLFFALETKNMRAMTFNVEKMSATVVSESMKFIGRPHNFGKPASLILKDSEEMTRQKRIQQERMMKLENELREAENAKKREKELAISEQLAKVEQEETRLLAKFSKPQREWLVTHVAPTLADGLCFLIQEMPDDPIQLLGCFIGTTLPQELQAELMNEFQSDDEEEEEEEEDMGDQN